MEIKIALAGATGLGPVSGRFGVVNVTNYTRLPLAETIRFGRMGAGAPPVFKTGALGQLG